MVLLYLGKPDQVGGAGVRRSGRPLNLYCSRRVREMELTHPAVVADMVRTKELAGRLRDTAATRMRTMAESINQVEFPPFIQSLEQVFEDIHANAHILLTTAELHRLALANLLSTLEATVDALDNFSWQAGVCEARTLLRERMLSYIAQTYPLLGRAVSSYRSSPSG